MTLPFAEAHVSAQLDWNNLDAELEARVKAAARKAEQVLKAELKNARFPINVALSANVSQFRRDTQTALDAIVLRSKVSLSANVAAFRREAQTVLNTRTLDARANVRLQVTTAELQAFAAALQARLDRLAPHVNVRLNITNGAAFRAELAALTRNQTVNVDIDRRGGAGAKTARSSLPDVSGLVGGAGKVGLITAAVTGLTGAIGAAAGAVAVLGVGLASLGPVAMAGIATIAVGLGGIKDAFSALSAAEDSAGSDAAAQASAIKTATDQVTSAEKSVRNAKKDSEQAEKDLTTARKDAMKQMRDLNLEVRGGVLSEKEAQLDLADARKDLANIKPGDDYERAQLRVAKAEQSLLETRTRNSDLAEKQQEALAKGAEGSDTVVAAKDKLASANERVDETTKALADAQEALNDAQTKSSGAQDKAAQAMAKLSPNTQSFVLATRSLKDSWKELVKLPVQDALFAGADTGIKQLAEVAFPVLGRGMTSVATQINGLTTDFANFWKAPENMGALESIFNGAASFIGGLGPGLKQATTGVLSLGQAFEPVAGKIGEQLGGMLGQVGQAFTDAFNNGSLTQLISTFGDMLQGLGAGLNPLIDGLIQMGNIVGPTLGPLFTSIGQAVQTIAPALGQIGATFATTLTAIMPDLANFISALATGLQPVLPVIGDLLQSLMTALTPLIDPLSQIAQVVGIALSQAITALAPAMKPMGDAFVSLITALSPIIPVIANVVAGLITALAPALTTIFNAAGPLIQQIADLLMPIFKQLQPILADVAQKIGGALADAMNQLAPHLPELAKAFGDLIMAVAPILPQLVDLAVKMLPPLLDVLIALLPLIEDQAKLWTWLVLNVIEPYVIPTFEKMATTIGEQLGNAATVIKAFSDHADVTLRGIAGFFTGLGDTVTSVWDTIVKGIKSAAREIGKFLVGLPEVKIPDLPGIPGRGTTIGFSGIGKSMIEWAGAEGKATGGRLVRGPGTGTSDSIPALLDGVKPLRLSDGEFVSTAAAYSAGAPLLHALNAGWVPSPEFLRTMVGGVPGFAGGGLVTADQLDDFAKGIEGATYNWGGVHWGDCSGAASALANYATGAPPWGSRFTTATEGQALAAMGAQPGIGPSGSLSFGWYNGGPYGGHTSMTLPNGTKVEMGGARGDGQYGGAAEGANSALYTDHMHFPPEFFLGGDPKTAGGSTTPATTTTTGGGGGGSTPNTSSTTGGGPTVLGATGIPATPDLNVNTGPAPTGIAAANEWASKQDFAGKFQAVGVDALKSIVGEFSDNFGLKSLTDKGIDQAVTAAKNFKLADTINYYGMDPQKVADETEKMLGRTTAISDTYRNG
ncbi:hypothetical protein ACFXG4_08290 [Nocardia sp. NPDC059246]|uniref:phage tail protein n=1 Tax=unclassified Nocardia TaxID=2637762 RepID=UPI0036CB617F